MAGQNPVGLWAQAGGTGPFVGLRTDANNGGLLTAETPSKTMLNLSAATVVKNTAGRVNKIIVASNSGTLAGAVYDATTTSPGTATLIAPIAAAAGTILDLGGFPCATGIVVVPGSGMVLALSYS